MTGQAQKAIFALNAYINKFVNINNVNPSLVLSPILCYASEVWGFTKANNIERVHMQFYKRLLSIKRCTQNEFVYGELGRCSFQNKRFNTIKKNWLKIFHCQNIKYVKKRK